MKNKKCEILLVSEEVNQLKNWIKQYNETFKSVKNPVQNTDIRKCVFQDGAEKITDFRSNIVFYSNLSRNNIYFISNQIKSNPIKFS